VNIKETFPLD